MTGGRLASYEPWIVLTLGACSFDPGDRWLDDTESASAITCELGERQCGTALRECRRTSEGPAWQVVEDCASQGLVCAPALRACTDCVPSSTRCEGTSVATCRDDGSGFEQSRDCDTEGGSSCRDGACVNLCALAGEQRSNVGCEYWAVDLDNANIDASLNAASQQFAVVLSNPQPDLVAEVTIEQDESAPGEDENLLAVARASIPPLSLQIFRLGPREVDGSPPGEFNTGTHTALSRAAYRVRTTVPVVAYQFNPLENVNVFSNDASLLKPVEALRTPPGPLSTAYVVIGWPQTIASTEDPNTNFSASAPMDLRSFLTVVGTRPDTLVRVRPTARVLGGGAIPETPAGGALELTLGPFEVANLETDDFNADFTGTLVDANGPVVVFSGSEAADAPFFQTLSDRRCCADHLEEQMDPVRTAGKRFLATVSPNRTQALAHAGADLVPVEAAEFFRVIAVTPAGARVRTTLDGSDGEIELDGLGSANDIASTVDFVVESDEPVMLASISPSQAAAGIPRTLPGGDPSFLVIPPVEQFRTSYVFLTPDRYSFDFTRIIAPVDATVRLDGESLDEAPGCVRRRTHEFSDATEFVVYECQLSFPALEPSSDGTATLHEGTQNDGVHEVLASRPVGVLVDGFDRHVSYAYAGGTELREIVPH